MGVKTTIIKALLGLIAADDGSSCVLGTPSWGSRKEGR